MSSELQRQVQSIRKQHLAVVPLHQGRPSLFLTAAEAAAVDVSTIHEAAETGLATLQQYDARFEPYHDTLLHASSVDLQRETKTAAENKALDVQINALLKLLSLYAMEPSTHLVLEYLIRRYRIHEMNTHELIQSMLVAHDTKVRQLQFLFCHHRVCEVAFYD
jgi:U3 small nucleolar RNA-associated protein 10